jgi:tetratricopeptide (TPR) repeat protein
MGNIAISEAQENLKLGLKRFDQMKYDESYTLLQASLTSLQELFGKVPDNPETGLIYESLGKVLLLQGKPDQALQYSLKAYKMYVKLRGSSHSDTTRAHMNCKEAMIKCEDAMKPSSKATTPTRIFKKRSSERSLNNLNF